MREGGGRGKGGETFVLRNRSLYVYTRQSLTRGERRGSREDDSVGGEVGCFGRRGGRTIIFSLF